jgi:hypothetical protein
LAGDRETRWTLIIDEAHHIGATRWSKFRETFQTKLILQFTATRLDEGPPDGRFSLHQHQCHRLADDIAGADHDHILAFDLDSFMVQEFDDAIRRTGWEHRRADDEAADIVEMEAIDVLFDGDRFQNARKKIGADSGCDGLAI